MPSKPKLADPGTLIRAGKLRTDEFRVCLDPDLVGEYERLLLAKAAAKDAARDSLAGGAVAEIEQQIADALEAMESSTLTLVLTALSRPKFRDMMDRHPPRRDEDGKLTTHSRDVLGVAYEPFFDELLRASIVEPVLAPEDLDLLLDERLTDGQWDALTTMAWNLNRETVSVPFSSAGSPRTRRSSRK